MGWAGPFNSSAAVGGAGSASANQDTPVKLCGEITAVYIRYNDSPPNTTDVTIKTKGNSAPSYNVLVVSNANTNSLFIPQKTIVDPTGLAITFDGTHGVPEEIPVDDVINIQIDGANAGDSVDVWFYLDED